MRVRFYKTAFGRTPAREFIASLSQEDKDRIFICLRTIEQCGFDAGGMEFRLIDGKLWEIKIRGTDRAYRLFYVSLRQETMVVLHGYKKQSQKAPIKEIQLAKQRMREVLNETSYYTA